MPIWTPPNHVSSKEMVGRRAFGSRVFDKSDDRVLQFRINVFLDERQNTGLSVDRLGVRSAEPEVLTRLLPYCDEMAEHGSTSFAGWAQLSVKDIKQTVLASEPQGEDHPYHAEVDRSNFPTPESLRALAFELCVHASKHEFIHRSGVG